MPSPYFVPKFWLAGQLHRGFQVNAMTAPYFPSEFWLPGLAQAAAVTNLVAWGVRTFATHNHCGKRHAIAFVVVWILLFEGLRRVGMPTSGHNIVGGLLGFAWGLWLFRRDERIRTSLREPRT